MRKFVKSFQFFQKAENHSIYPSGLGDVGLVTGGENRIAGCVRQYLDKASE
jgi:hypothetical protein